MTVRRLLAMVIGAIGPLGLLALLFGNQWVIDSLGENRERYTRGAGMLVQWLQFPRWRITTGSLSSDSVLLIVVLGFCLVLYLAVVGLLVFAAARTLDPARGALGALVVPWWAALVAGGVVGWLRGMLETVVFDLPGSMGSMLAWNTASQGLGFGLAYGWLAGIGGVVAFLVTKPAAYAPQVPGAPLPPPQPQPPLPPDHPAAMPYTPPAPGAVAVVEPAQAPEQPAQPPAAPQPEPAAAPETIAEQPEAAAEDVPEEAAADPSPDAAADAPEDDPPQDAPEKDAPEEQETAAPEATRVEGHKPLPPPN